MGWFLPHLFEHALLKWFHNFVLLTEIVDKSAIPNSIFKFNSSFLVSLNNFIYEIESTNLFEHLWLNILNFLWEKEAARLNFWQYILNIILEIFMLLAGFLKNLTRRVISRNFAGLLLWILFPGRSGWLLL